MTQKSIKIASRNASASDSEREHVEIKTFHGGFVARHVIGLGLGDLLTTAREKAFFLHNFVRSEANIMMEGKHQNSAQDFTKENRSIE